MADNAVPNNPMATAVMNEVLGLVQSIAQFQNKTVFVYNEDNLMDKLKTVTFPAAALVYNGMKAKPSQGSGPKGISVDLHFSILVVQRGESVVSTDTKFQSFGLLDGLRNAILGTRSVTGHFYEFLMEAPADLKGGNIFWMQRWSVPAQIRPNH